jgi:hypothetical protein
MYMANYTRALQTAKSVYTNQTPDGLTKIKSLSTRTSKVYEDENNVYLAFRGTDTSSASDLFSDLFIAGGLDKQSPRYRTNKEKFISTKNYYAGSNKNMILTGHSLGGMGSETLASEKGVFEAYSFNSGANPYYKAKDALYDKVGGKIGSPIHAYSTGTDIISLGIHVPQKNKTSTIVPRKKGVNAHSLDNFD